MAEDSTEPKRIDDDALDAAGISADISPFAREWLKGKTAQDFEVLEHLGRVHWPVKLQRRRKGPDGKVIWAAEEPALLRVLDTRDRMKAIDDATKLFDARGLKISDPRHQAIWTEIEKHAHVALALREAVDAQTGKPYADGVEPHQKATLEYLLVHAKSGITAVEVTRLYELLQTFEGFEDPKLEKVDPALCIKIALAVAEVGNLSPLAATGGQGPDSCVVYWARILSDFLRGERSSPSPESSTPERSPKRKSA